LLLAELNPAQPAGFVFAHQLPGFRATPAAPNFYYRCLLVHPATASQTAAREQMGCSNAYIPRHDPVDARTMGGIVRDACLNSEQFRKLL
jgi:hypothetical protein